MGTNLLISELAKQSAPSTRSDAPRALRVCFVCTGNTCRSPMAEAVANDLAQTERESFVNALPEQMRDCVTCRIEACSAGLHPIEGDPIAPYAVEALERAEVRAREPRDYHRHRATTLTEALVNECDLLVAMSDHHALEMFLRYPQAARKITSMPHAISDPYGGDLSRYESCLSEITEGVKTLFWGETDA